MILRLALAMAATSLSLSACERVSDDAFGQKVRTYLLAHPEVLLEAQARLQEKQAAEATKIAQASLVQNRQALERDPRDFVANPEGSITVVEFYDYNCGWCKVAAPEVVKLIRANPDVRFVFKDYVIFGADSELAARVALTPAVRAKTLDFHQRLMAQKPANEAAIDRELTALDLNPAAVKTAANSPEITQHLNDTRALAEKLRIGGTPHFVIGDEMIEGANLKALELAIAKARAGKAS
ncbi:MAG TPA: DsbA family protein [Phenylobacterium sp.]